MTASTLRCLVVDDERLARDTVVALLREDPELEVVGECATGNAAVTCLEERSVDLVFLDVQMPGMSGFDVIRAVGPERMPIVVFVTAYDDFAVRAFESQALDYLLKPFDDERFEASLERAKQACRTRDQAALGRKLSATVSERPEAGSLNGSIREVRLPASDGERRISVPSGGRVVMVDPEEIRWVEAARYCVRIHTAGESLLVRDSLARVLRTLGEAFVRTHRSAVVNLLHVVELARGDSGEHFVVLRDGTRVRLSRSRRRRLQERLEG